MEGLNALYGAIKYDLERISGSRVYEKDLQTIRKLASDAFDNYVKGGRKPIELIINIGERVDCVRSGDLKIDRRIAYSIVPRTY
ncbi:hypothetical protein PHIN6_07860 [Polynucleobacter sp. HIN6]|uniref:hypothetical protein n=1 Tax=Polynucleobacter sp. HIN6 TaxID=3047865 RepID=UPI0025740B9B|nr:hypothetical protein [Polynucleobacter sp. HIN6]BEI35268.1 hypothetical protein PHIN6_07860 [Polynucleobacter sp. HIN6]